MTGVFRGACLTAALLVGAALASSPANAQQFIPFGRADGDMMTQMAPMLEMMKARMGKRRFGQMMRTMGPMMAGMMDGGGFGGISPDSFGGGDVMGMIGGNGGEMTSLIPQIMQMAGGFGGGHGRRYRRRHM